VPNSDAYPFCLPFLRNGFELGFDAPVTIIVGENGTGTLLVFQERCQRQGFFIFDEPESALSRTRQLELLKLLRRIDRARNAQVIMATHAPMLMACPNARLLHLACPPNLKAPPHMV
jgi:predicted ATPase